MLSPQAATPDRLDEDTDTLGLGPLLVWAFLGLVPLVTVTLSPASASGPGLAFMSALTAAFGVWGFWKHGGARISAPGLWCLASAIFVGLAGMWWWVYPEGASSFTFTAVAIGFWTTVAMYAFFWRSYVRSPETLSVSDAVTVRGFWIGLAVSFVGLSLWVAGIRVGATLIQELSFVGLFMLTTSLVMYRPDRKQLVVKGAIVLGTVGVYSETVFSGYGRLILVALGLGPMVVLSVVVHRRTIKTLIVASVAPALSVFISMRESLGQSRYGESLSGIGSVVTPVRDLGRLMEQMTIGAVPAGSGETFFASITVLVPREVWPDKPVGFGAHLTEILQPELVAIGQSLAALSQGEWFFNFSWLGLPLMVLVLGPALRSLDNRFVRSTSAGIHLTSQLLWLNVMVLLIADVPNLMWVGTFGYVARTGIRALIVTTLYVCSRILASRVKPTESPGRRLTRERQRAL